MQCALKELYHFSSFVSRARKVVRTPIASIMAEHKDEGLMDVSSKPSNAPQTSSSTAYYAVR